jgi:putative selenium metabolism hydrolase
MKRHLSLESQASQLVDLCQRLVRIESRSGREAGVADLVEATMQTLGYDRVERDELGSVVGTVTGAGAGRSVLFDAHMDTVEVGEPDRWSHEPLGGLEGQGRIWGRGATDVKGSLAALLLAVGTMPRDALAGTVTVSASVGEESMEGAALTRVLETAPADCVVICEPTGLRLCLGHKGRASLIVEAEGRAAHTSEPERGDNAVYRLVEAIPALRALSLPKDPLLGKGVMELVEVSSLPFPGSSMVPYRAVARFDRRIVQGETRQGVIAELRQALESHPKVAARYQRAQLDCYTGRRLEEEVFHPCWVTSPESDVVGRAREALRSVEQEDSPTYAPFCTNGSASAGELGVPTLIYGAGFIADAHVVDEGIDIEQLLGAYRGYGALARALSAAGSPNPS